MERKSGESFTSSLKFINYIVNNVNFRYNENVNKEKRTWKLTFDIDNKVSANIEKDKFKVELTTSLFKGIEDAPFYLDVTITGYFELVGEDDIMKFEANAIAIMYPYLRAIVSTYTASANVSPVILPAINVKAKKKNKRGQEKMEKD